MKIITDTYHVKNRKTEKRSVKDFAIDTTHYKSKGPRIIKTIDIDL